MRADVVVVGGGSAGLAAAVSAARLGARTLLLERDGVLGGMAPSALVHSICGLYRLPEGDAAPRWANHGFAEEFATRLLRSGGASGPVRMGRVQVLLQQPTAFARLADEIVRETEHLEVRLHSEVIRVEDEFRKLEVICRGRREPVEASALIDASGDAVAAALGGAVCEQEEAAHLQRPAFVFALAGVEAHALTDDARLRLAQRFVAAVRAGKLPEGALGAALRMSGRGSEAAVTIDLAGDEKYDPTDAACLTALEMEGRSLAGAVADFLRGEVEGFGASFISAFPARVGVRESRRIVGRHRVEEEHLLGGTDSPDAVAYAAWPMELRETNTGPRLRYPENGQPAAIRLNALRAQDHYSLFMAGRCISCSHEAQASIRVIGTCLATGEAAGLAAALQAEGGEVSAPLVRAARASLQA